MGKLLFDEQPIVVDKQLALAVGFDEAAIVQQIHYWCEYHRRRKDGRCWTYNTTAAWRENFPFWGEDKIKKLLLRLENIGVVISRQDMNQSSWDRTKWYAVDHDRLAVIHKKATFVGPLKPQVGEISQGAKRHDGTCETASSIEPNGIMDHAESHEQYHEVTQEASHEAAADRTAPAAASSPAAPPPKTQNLSPGIEAAIQALPAEQQADARQVCAEEEVADQVKLDAISLFAKRLAQGKAEDCGWLRKAVKGDWGAKERVKEEQKAERQEQAEAAKRAEAERQEQEREADRRELLARQKRFFSLPEAERQLLEDQARRILAAWDRPDPDSHGLVSMALDILDGLVTLQPQGLSASST